MIAPGPGTESTALGGGYGEMLVGSLLVLVLVCVAAWLVVRFGVRRLWGPRGGQVMDVVARVPLEPRRSLYVVEVAGKTLLVGTSEMGLSVLSELDRDAVRARLDAPERSRSIAASFADAVRSAMGRRKAPQGGGVAPALRHGLAGARPAQGERSVASGGGGGVGAGTGSDGGGDGGGGGGGDGDRDGDAGDGAGRGGPRA